jgi:hypothetical protein
MKRRYVYRDGQMVERTTGEPMVTGDWQPVAPLIRDFSPYACPITGKEIRTPQQHADNLKRHGCVEYNEVAGQSRMNGKLKNKRFAKKLGREVAEEYR